MMKNIDMLMLAGSVLMLSLASCTKNLELNPVSNISSKSFWNTADDALGARNGMYVRLRAQARGNLFAWGELRSEVLGPSFGGAAGLQLFYLNELNQSNVGARAANGLVNSTWQGMYTVIHDANLLLKYGSNVSFPSEEAKNQILAEAHAMRAYAYFVLTRTWGDLPLVIEPTEGYDPNVIMKERSSKTAVMELIKADIDAALSLFPTNDYPSGRSTWSKPAVNALKADVYLWTAKLDGGGNSDFQTALAAVEEIENSNVSLLPNFADVFDYNNKGNNEILMAIRFQDVESADNIYNSMYILSAYMNPAVDAETRERIGILGGVPICAMTEGVRNQFSQDDQRRYATFIEMYTPNTAGGRDFYGSVVSKFRGTIIGGARAFLDDYILYRYSDVLLMKAEAQNALGEDPSGAINIVRERAYGDNFDDHRFQHVDAARSDDAILQERLLELALEGKRWWDLVRFGKAFDLVPSLQDRKGQDHLLLFPISESTLSLEPKIKQNPGYIE